MRWLSWIFICANLGGCIASGPAAPEGRALLITGYPIVLVDGNAVESSYALELAPGNHSITVVYQTYSWNYHCQFEWEADADQRYEVVDSDNVHPLTLYRWVRINSLWAARYDPVNPVSCEKRAT